MVSIYCLYRRGPHDLGEKSGVVGITPEPYRDSSFTSWLRSNIAVRQRERCRLRKIPEGSSFEDSGSRNVLGLDTSLKSPWWNR